MLFVGVTYRRCGGVGVEIILLLSECHATLIDIQDVPSGIFLVGGESGAHGYTIAEGSIFELQLLQRIFGLAFLNFLEQWQHRLHTLAVAACGVHGKFIEITEFLLHRALAILILRQFGEDSVDALVVVLLQAVETAET